MGQAEKRYFVTLEINGTQRTVEVEARKLLVHLIREDFGLTGTHVGCDTRNAALAPWKSTDKRQNLAPCWR